MDIRALLALVADPAYLCLTDCVGGLAGRDGPARLRGLALFIGVAPIGNVPAAYRRFPTVVIALVVRVDGGLVDDAHRTELKRAISTGVSLLVGEIPPTLGT